jgi:hypothetical protein
MQIVCASGNELLIVVNLIVIFTTHPKPIASEEAKVPISRKNGLNVSVDL